jgi:hypothetical protein
MSVKRVTHGKISLGRRSPDFRWSRGQDRLLSILTDILRVPGPFGRDLPSLGVPRQRNSIAPNPLIAKMPRRWASRGRNWAVCLHQGAPPLSSLVACDPISRSCWRRRCSKARDERQDFLEHLPRHRDLGHLERDVPAVADHLGTDLDQLLPQAGQ